MKQRLFSNRQLVRLIIPLIIEYGLTVLVGMCDGVMVSSVGEAAISGVTLVDMVNSVVLVLFSALATGGAVVISQFLGANDAENAQQATGQLVLLAGILGVMAMVLCLVFTQTLLDLFFGTIEQKVMEASLTYFRITALSFPFIALYHAGAAMFRSMGNSKLSMKVSFLMNIINVSGNALCILVLKMGVAGVAVPTLVSRAVAAAVVLVLASRPGQALTLRWETVVSLDRSLMRSIMAIGIPSACENSLFHFGRLVVGSMIALHGITHTSAYSVANTISALGNIPGQAMILAMVTVIGQCVGAGDRKQTYHYLKKMMLAAYTLHGCGQIVIAVSLKWLIGLYLSLSPDTIALASKMVMIYSAAGFVLWPASFILPNALRAANDVKYTMWVGIGSMFLFRVIGSWFLCVQMGLGALGVWYAMVVDWICRVSFFVPRVLSGTWLKKGKL